MGKAFTFEAREAASVSDKMDAHVSRIKMIESASAD